MNGYQSTNAILGSEDYKLVVDPLDAITVLLDVGSGIVDDATGEIDVAQLEGNARASRAAGDMGSGGTTNEAGDGGMGGSAGGAEASGIAGVGGESNPSLLYASDQFVYEMKCRPYPLGTTREAGGDSLLGNTECATVECGRNEAVMGNDCAPCVEGVINEPGDDDSGPNTVCHEVASPLAFCFDIERCRRECPEGDANLDRRLACLELAPMEAPQLYQALLDCLAREECRRPNGAFDQNCANNRCADELDTCRLT